MSKDTLLRLPLQYFAEGGNDDGATGTPSNNDPAAEGAGDNTPPQPQTFDDVLKNKDYQSEFDKRIAKALETARTKWDTETQEKLSEAKKLEKMNAEQKATYEREQNEKKLAEREAAITRRELTATAKETLISKGMPAELADVLDYTDAEKCNASIDSVAKAFAVAVEKSVNDRLRGTPPKAGDKNNNSDPFIDGFGV